MNEEKSRAVRFVVSASGLVPCTSREASASPVVSSISSLKAGNWNSVNYLSWLLISN